MTKETKTKYEALLDAGVEVFFKRGISKATIDEIVNQAKCGKGTFYKYFKNKNNMLEILGIEFSKKIISKLEDSISDTKTIRENLLGVLKAFLSIFHENKKLGKVMHERDMRMSDEEHKKAGKIGNEDIALIRACLSKIIDRKSVKKVKPGNLLSVLIGSAHFFLMREMKFGIPFSDQDIEEVIDVILYGVIEK